jgi:hypothetical protein
MSNDLKQRYKELAKRLTEFELEPDQLIAKLIEVRNLAILATEERINPKMDEPVEVKVRNLPVALACVKTMIELAKDIRDAASDDLQREEVRYELVQSWVEPESDWCDNNATKEADNA